MATIFQSLRPSILRRCFRRNVRVRPCPSVQLLGPGRLTDRAASASLDTNEDAKRKQGGETKNALHSFWLVQLLIL